MNDRKDTSYLFSGELFAKGRISANAGVAQRWPIVLVVGMPRSGMSLCAHILSAMGIDIADEISVPPRTSETKGSDGRSSSFMTAFSSFSTVTILDPFMISRCR